MLCVKNRLTAETSPEELAELMVGRKVLLRVDRGTSAPGDVKLSGVTTAQSDLRSAIEEIRKIEGVESVTSDTIVIPASVGP